MAWLPFYWEEKACERAKNAAQPNAHQNNNYEYTHMQRKYAACELEKIATRSAHTNTIRAVVRRLTDKKLVETITFT